MDVTRFLFFSLILTDPCCLFITFQLAELESHKRNDRATYYYALERQKQIALEEENRIGADSSISVLGKQSNQGSYRPSWSRFF